MDYSKMKKVDETSPIEKRIGFLQYCSKLYEHDGTSPLSDLQWDNEYYALQKIDPNNAFFDEVGGKIEEGIYGEIIPHNIVMGSLNKSLSIKEFKSWLESTYASNDNLQFLLQHKIDGLSVSLVYKNGQLIQALTRGDGEKGVNVLNNCKFITDIPQKISCLGEVEIRGEIYKDRADFQKNWKSLGYANERNFASGSLNQKNASETGKRNLSFLAYIVLRKDDLNYRSNCHPHIAD